MRRTGLKAALFGGITCLLATISGLNTGAETRIYKGPYHGWEAFIISNGNVEAVVVPQVGRIMQFRLAGEDDGPFWENRALDGKSPDAAVKEWGNFGGDKTWPSPQSAWEKVTGRGWPPPAAFDSMSVKARIDKETLVLESSIDPHYGIQTERTISLDSNKSEMRVRTVYLKKTGEPIKTGIWVITQLKHPEKVLMPLPRQSIFEKGYNEQSEKLPAALEIKDRLLSCERSTHDSTKIGSDADTLIWGDSRWVLKIISRREKGGEFPDRGSSAEIYTNPDPLKYVELELLGPLSDVKIGDRIEREQRYELTRREHKVLADSARTE